MIVDEAGMLPTEKLAEMAARAAAWMLDHRSEIETSDQLTAPHFAAQNLEGVDHQREHAAAADGGELERVADERESPASGVGEVGRQVTAQRIGNPSGAGLVVSLVIV